MADLATVEAALRKADAAGDTAGARVLAREHRRLSAGGGASTKDVAPSATAEAPRRLGPDVPQMRAGRPYEPSVMERAGRFAREVIPALRPRDIIQEDIKRHAEEGLARDPAEIERKRKLEKIGRGVQAGIESVPGYMPAKGAIGEMAFGDEGNILERAGAGALKGLKEQRRTYMKLGPEEARKRQEALGPQMRSVMEEMSKRGHGPVVSFLTELALDPLTLFEAGAGAIAVTRKAFVARAARIGAREAALAEKQFDDAIADFSRQPEFKPPSRPEVTGQMPVEEIAAGEQAAIQAEGAQMARGKMGQPLQEPPISGAQRWQVQPTERDIRLGRQSAAIEEARVAEPLPKPSNVPPLEQPIIIAEPPVKVPTPLVQPRGITPAQRRSQAIQKLGLEEAPPVGELPPRAVSGERTMADIDRIVEAHERLEKNLKPSRLGRRGEAPIVEEVLNDLVAVGRHITTKVGGNFSVWSKRIVELYGESVRPYLLRVWEQIKTGHPLKAAGEAMGPGLRGFAKVVTTSPREKLGPGLQRLVSRAEDYAAEMGEGKWGNILSEEAKKLTSKDRAWLSENMAAVVEDGLKTENVAQQAFVDAWRNKVAPEVLSEAQGAGLGTRGLQRYFPRHLTEDAKEALIAERGPVYEALAREAKVRGIDINSMVEWVKKGFHTAKSGSLEFHRALDLPRDFMAAGVRVFEKDPFKLLPQYVSDSARRIGIAKAFGPNTAEVAQAMGKGLEATERKAWENVFKTLQRQPHIDTFTELTGPGGALRMASKVYGGARDIATAGFLSGSQLANLIGGWFTIATKAGVGRTLQGMGRVFSGKGKADIALAERMGAINRGTGYWKRVREVINGQLDSSDLSAYTPTQHLGKMSKAWLDLTGLSNANRPISRVAASVSKNMLDEAVGMARKGDKSLLDFMAKEYAFDPDDIKRILSVGPTDSDYGRVMRQFASRTNPIKESALDLPRWATHPISRDVLAYTTFTRTVGNISGWAAKEAENGNFAPAITLLVGGVASTDTVIRVKNLIRGRTQEDVADGLWHALMNSSLGGIPGELLVGVSYALRRGETELLGKLTPPAIEATAGVVGPLLKGKPGKAMKSLRKQMFAVDVFALLMGEKPLRRTGEKPAPTKPKGRFERPGRFKENRFERKGRFDE